MNKEYVHYGCGLSAPNEWTNFDVSPTLRLQKIPLIGKIITPRLNVVFPKNVIYGNIISGLPVKDNSCKAVFCSHTLEHLSLKDCRIAISNSYKMLAPQGIFRLIVPDLLSYAKQYVQMADQNDADASIRFMQSTLLGLEERPGGLRQKLIAQLGNSKHLWMWDEFSLKKELNNAGFSSVRRCYFGDSSEAMFSLVENEYRYNFSIGLEAIK